jgi:hypothetical protein
VLVKILLERKPHPEQGYRSCLGIMRLGKHYGPERMEAAATRAITSQACSYQSVKSILERGLDKAPLTSPESPAPVSTHENLRGPSYYAEEGRTPC